MIRFPVSQPCLGPRERALLNQCLDDNRVSGGAMVERFEREFAAYLAVPHAIVTTSGTTALHLALTAMGIGPGDEVIVPAMTFVATANAVHYTGARVVLADIDEETWCIDPRDVAEKVTPRTKAIVPVHLYGVAAPLVTLKAFHVDLVEDSAEGLGGNYLGQALGTFGRAGVFSFYGNKVMTTGEGGAIVTEDEALAKRLRFLRGQALDPVRRYYHPEIGFNYRMTDLQAAIGVGQLTHLDEMLKRRAELIAIYRRQLQDYGYTPVMAEAGHAPWMFTIKLASDLNRDRLMAAMTAAGVETRPTFVPMHQLPMWRQLPGRLPVATSLGQQGISLPTYPDLTFDEVHEICDIFRRACDAQAG